MPNKLLQVCLNNLWGIINTQNEAVVPIVYDYVFPPIQEQIIIKQNKRYGVIGFNRVIIVETECNSYNDALIRIRNYDNNTSL